MLDLWSMWSVGRDYAINPLRTKSTFEFDNLRKIIIIYYLEECSGIDVHWKVIDLKFQILYVQLDSLMLPPIFYYDIWNWNSKFLLNLITKNINLFCIRFVGIGLKCDTLDAIIFWIFFGCMNLWPHFNKITFKLQIWLGQTSHSSMFIILVNNRFY
jgi:hypothetical protein